MGVNRECGFQRVLILHSYPPTPCLYGFEKALRLLNYDVRVAASVSHYGDATQFAEMEPFYRFVEVTETFPTLASLFAQTGGEPDWVLYLLPNQFFIPADLERSSVPTVGFLTEEYKHRKMYETLFHRFDLCPTSFPHIAAADAAAGLDNRPCFDFRWLQWQQPTEYPRERDIDVCFVGAVGIPGVTTERDKALAELVALKNEFRVTLATNVWLRKQMNLYARSRVVWQHSGQGENNLTFRISEATTAGAMVLAKRPDTGDLAGLVEDESVVLYDTPEEMREKLTYYLSHESERRAVVHAAQGLMLGSLNYVRRVADFVELVQEQVTGDFLGRRKERLRR